MKAKFPLIFAIVIGVAALFAIRSYVNKMEEKTKAQLKGKSVLAASRDIEPGTEITTKMLSPKEVPQQFIPPQAIQGSAEVKQVLGRKAAVKIKAGQLVLWTDLESEGRGGLSMVIPANEGAYTISLSKGIKGALLQPSDHIDILGSFAAPKPAQPAPAGAASWRQGSDMVNVVLLQNVTVLAVGETLGGQTRSLGASTTDITVALTLPEAQLLMFASEHGELGAVLRREGVTEVKPRGELPRITFADIEKVIGDLDAKRSMRMVEVHKGVKTQSIPVASVR